MQLKRLKSTLLNKVVCILLLPCAIFAQGNNNPARYRVVGGQDGSVPEYGGSKIFSHTTWSDTNSFSTPRLMWSNGANISSKAGQLLFYTNGWTVIDRNGAIVPDGDSLSPTPYMYSHIQYAYNFPQSSFIFQHYNDSSVYTMLHTTIYQNIQFGPLNLWRSEFKLNTDSSVSVIEKNIVLLSDTLELNGIIGCRHGNGRDWWVLVKKWNSIKYYSLLFTPDTTIIYENDVPGSPLMYDLARMTFSYDGTYYATYDNNSGLRLFSFDRCSGLLNILSHIPDPDNSTLLGVSANFSPHGNYLYFNNTDKIYRVPVQSALTPADVELVHTYTLFVDSVFNYACHYFAMELSNDGKLYIGSVGSCRYFCTIDNPDAPDVANIGYNHFNFKIPNFNNQTYTNHTNYGLGPLTGSPCDTLGLSVGAELRIKNDALRIGPNPNNGNFSLSFNKQLVSGMLYIYDVDGKLVYSEYVAPVSSLKNLQLEGKLSNGMYAVSLVFGRQTATGKFIVK